MLPPMETSTLVDGLVGGAAGAGIVALVHFFRDRHRLIARWRTGAEPDDSLYLPDGPSEEERRNLPAAMAAAGVAAGTSWIGIVHQNQAMAAFGMAVLILFALVHTLMEDRVVETGAPPSCDTDKKPRPSRMVEAIGHLVALGGLAAFVLFDAEDFEWLRREWGITAGIAGALFFAGILATGGWSLFRLWQALPNAADIGHRATYDTTRQDIYRMLAAIATTGAVTALIIWPLF